MAPVRNSVSIKFSFREDHLSIHLHFTSIRHISRPLFFPTEAGNGELTMLFDTQEMIVKPVYIDFFTC